MSATIAIGRWICDTEADLLGLGDEGDSAYTKNTKKFWIKSSTGWEEKAGGSGGIGPLPLPSNFVEDETSYGQQPSAGDATTYSRSNHTHGTPPLSDAAPLALGSPSPGSASTPARSDHVHPPTGLALSTHNHDAVYYPRAEADAKFALSDHTHPGGSGVQTVKLGADFANSLTTAASITGLGIPVTANQEVAFRWVLVCTAAAATTGTQLAVNGPASPTEFTADITLPTSTTAKSFLQVNAYDTFLAATASPGTTRVIATIEGVLRNGPNAGTLVPRIRSEVATSAVTAKRGSNGTWF